MAHTPEGWGSAREMCGRLLDPVRVCAQQPDYLGSGSSCRTQMCRSGMKREEKTGRQDPAIVDMSTVGAKAALCLDQPDAVLAIGAARIALGGIGNDVAVLRPQPPAPIAAAFAIEFKAYVLPGNLKAYCNWKKGILIT